MLNSSLTDVLKKYDEVGVRYIRELENRGLVFDSKKQDKRYIHELHKRLEQHGAINRNASASFSYGFISPACLECTGVNGSETFSTSFKCSRNCYYCINFNVSEYDKFVLEGCPWEETLEQSIANNQNISCIGITGGEPLLDFNNVTKLLKRVNEVWPEAHKRLYTTGDSLTDEEAEALSTLGLAEIRFSVKLDTYDIDKERLAKNLALARKYIPTVMIEMPVIPGTQDQMHSLLKELDGLIDGINLLEFCFPFANWNDYQQRGFKLKNPPFDVYYDYEYTGGLAVADSEIQALELMLWAIDNKISFGLHYCSLENKHRSEVRQKNERLSTLHPCLMFDPDDFFIKTAKVFECDLGLIRSMLESLGCDSFITSDDEDSLAFHPHFIDPLRKLAKSRHMEFPIMLCYFILESSEEGSYLVDVTLKEAI